MIVITIMLVHYTFTSTHLLACIYISTWLNINIIKTFSPHHFVRALNNNLKKECCWTSHYNLDITKFWLGPPFQAPHSSNEAFVCCHRQEACYKKLFVFVCVCLFSLTFCLFVLCLCFWKCNLWGDKAPKL